MLTWKIDPIDLELKYTWKIARNASDIKHNFIISVTDGSCTGKGEVAPNIRFGETPESVSEEYRIFLKSNPDKVREENDLLEILSHKNFSNAFKFGITSAWTHYICKKEGLSVPEYFGLEYKNKTDTSYTLPIMPSEDIKPFLDEYNLTRFKTLKVKISEETAVPLLKELRRYSSQCIRVDANEAWKDPDKLMQFLEKIRLFNIQYLEQPFPANMEDEYRYLKKISPVPVMGDESVTDNSDISALKDQFHAVNMKLMKAGSYRKGIEILKKAKEAGLDTMIGCMVETSIGIWSGMNLISLTDHADLDGSFMIKDEPFGLVEEKDGLIKQTRK